MSETRNTMQTLIVNDEEFWLRDDGAVRADAAQSLTEAQKAQARANIGIYGQTAATDEKYFTITDDGVISLMPEYRGLGDDQKAFQYSESDNGFGYEGSKIAELPENIVIPEIVNEIAVVSLAPGMFCKNNRIKSLIIPSYITDIPDRFCDQAFYLERIDGTENVETIGRAVFQKTRLKTIAFPKLKTASGTGHFNGCYELVSADIGNEISALPNTFFRYCERLSSIRGGGNVKTIGDNSLRETTRLKNLSFAPNLTAIGKNGLYLSRVNYDWSTHTAEYGENATFVRYNPVNFWSGYWDNHTITPCEIPLRSTFHQANPQWLLDAAAAEFPENQVEYAGNCSAAVQAFIYSAYENMDISSPVTYMCAVREKNPDAMNTDPGQRSDTGEQDGVHVWMSALGYHVERVDFDPQNVGNTIAALERVYQALNEGKFVIGSVVSSLNPGVRNHAVLLYGINSSGEVLVINAGTHLSNDGKTYRPLTYAMPIQNMAAFNSLFDIVSKPEQSI